MVSTGLLDKLSKSFDPVPRVLNPVEKVQQVQHSAMDELTFRWQLNEDAMGTEKLSEGIRKFAIDCVKLEQIVQTMLNSESKTLSKM
jgi:transaldolase